MLTHESLADSILRYVGASIYFIVLFGLIVFVLHECYANVKLRTEEKNDKERHADSALHKKN